MKIKKNIFCTTIDISNRIYIKDESGKELENYPYGYLSNINKIYKNTVNYNILNPLPKESKIKSNLGIKIKARLYQQESIKIFKPNTFTGSYIAPPGAGKTNIMAYLIAQRNIKTIVLAHKDDLIQQTKERFLSVLNINESQIGLLNGNCNELGKDIVICTWQSLSKSKNLELAKKHNYGMLLIDEWQKSSGSEFYKLIDSLPILYKHGFTATNYRNNEINEKKLVELCGPAIQKIDINYLYKYNYLVKPDVTICKTSFTLDLERTYLCDIVSKKINNIKYRWVVANWLWSKESKIYDQNMKEISKKSFVEDASYFNRVFNTAISMEDEQQNEKKVDFSIKLGSLLKLTDLNTDRFDFILDDILKNRLDKKENRAILLTNLQEAAMNYYNALKKNGYSNVVLLLGTDVNKSEKIKYIKNSKNYILVSTTSLFAEGNDIPQTNKVFCVSPSYPPFKEASMLEQIIGRAVRTYEGKTSCEVIVYDDYSSGMINKKKEDTYLKIEDSYNIQFFSKTNNILIQNSQETLKEKNHNETSENITQNLFEF